MAQRIASVTLGDLSAELDGGAPAGGPDAAPPAGPLWTEEALRRLERVPEGFMRQSAKAMVEKHAAASGANEIDLAAAEAGLGQARERMREAMAGQGHPGAAAERPAAAGWECHLCGLHVRGSARPAACPHCGTGHFSPLDAERLAKAPDAAFAAITWDPVAERRLTRIPPGFMRDMTRWRVEKWSRAAGRPHVDLDMMDGKYGSWGAGSGKVELALAWSEEASARAARIPDFIRPMVQKEIERRVQAEGRTQVAAADIDKAMAHWSASGDFHGRGGGGQA